MGHSISLNLNGETLSCFHLADCNFQNVAIGDYFQAELGITRNNSQMFYRACELAGLNIPSFVEFLHGSKAGDIAPILKDIIFSLVVNKSSIKPLEPTNGWGGYVDLVDKLTALYQACIAYPEAIVEDWY